MANTVSRLTYANTFGDWVVVSNGLVNENNDLATSNYTKAAGTLFLNSPTLGLQVANTAIVSGQLQVSGVGSSALVQNGLTVGGNISGNTATLTGTLGVTGTSTLGPLSATSITSVNNTNVNGTLTASTGVINGQLTIGTSVITQTDGYMTVNISGNANTVNNGVYTTSSYSNPAWITAIANTKITGVINSNQIANTGVTAATYAFPTSLVIDAQGRISTAVAGQSPVTTITGNTNQITANVSTGNIKLTLPQNIDANANVQFRSIGVGTAPDTANTGSIRTVNNITSYYSDDRLKTRMDNISSALEKVQSLNGFYYTANDLAQSLGYSNKTEVGLSAQEVQSVLPEVIAPAPIDSQYMTIHYERVIPLLVEAIKELSAEVEKLKK
jgi:hypothetical protein